MQGAASCYCHLVGPCSNNQVTQHVFLQCCFLIPIAACGDQQCCSGLFEGSCEPRRRPETYLHPVPEVFSAAPCTVCHRLETSGGICCAFHTSACGSIMQQYRGALIPTAGSKRCKMKKPESSNWRWTRGSLPQPPGLDVWLLRPNLCWIPPWTLTCLLGPF